MFKTIFVKYNRKHLKNQCGIKKNTAIQGQTVLT